MKKIETIAVSSVTMLTQYVIFRYTGKCLSRRSPSGARRNRVKGTSTIVSG
jgi:hypothetical protein